MKYFLILSAGASCVIIGAGLTLALLFGNGVQNFEPAMGTEQTVEPRTETHYGPAF